MQPPISISTIPDLTVDRRLQLLTSLLTYTWGSRQVDFGMHGFPNALGPDVVSVGLEDGHIEIARLTTWRRLDRADVLHAVKVILRALAPEVPYVVSSAQHAAMQIALQADLLSGSTVESAGTYGLLRAEKVAEQGLDPVKTSILRARVPLVCAPSKLSP